MSLASEFAEILADQSPDWSDLAFELRLHDEAQFDEARLLMAPAQMERSRGERFLFTFHVSHTTGYGAYAPLVQSCLAKLDAAGITGDLELRHARQASRRNYTQGPVVAPPTGM